MDEKHAIHQRQVRACIANISLSKCACQRRDSAPKTCARQMPSASKLNTLGKAAASPMCWHVIQRQLTCVQKLPKWPNCTLFQNFVQNHVLRHIQCQSSKQTLCLSRCKVNNKTWLHIESFGHSAFCFMSITSPMAFLNSTSYISYVLKPHRYSRM